MSPYNEILCAMSVLCFRKEEREQELYLYNFHLNLSFKSQYFFIIPQNEEGMFHETNKVVSTTVLRIAARRNPRGWRADRDAYNVTWTLHVEDVTGGMWNAHPQ